MFLQTVVQNLVIDVGKELSDVTFQDPNCSRVIPRNFERVIAKPVYGAMYTFVIPAGIRVEDEFRIKVRI